MSQIEKPSLRASMVADAVALHIFERRDELALDFIYAD
jgi:hypothetical protein